MSKNRAGIALFIVISLLIVFEISKAQSYDKVVEVEVEGNRVASKSLILRTSSIDLGSPLTPTKSSEAIHRLYGLGIFSDIRIDVEQVLGGLKVYIIVKELPKLTGLEFIGNKKIKSNELKDELALGIGGYISPHFIEKKRNEIKSLYAEKGYFQATITSLLKYYFDSTEAVLTFEIEEKSKVKVEKVVLSGNKRVQDNQVIKKMRNRKRGFLKSSNFAQDKYEEDLDKVINEFHKLGYTDAYLISDSMSIDTTTNRMTIYLEVYEGPRFYFGKTEFKSNKEIPSEVLSKLLKYKEGDIFNSEAFDKSVEEIYIAYSEIGHLHMQHFSERNTRNDSLIDITFDISEGLPSRINMVKIIGNTKTKEKVIRRELSFLPGQKFSRALLVRSVRDVMALNYFGIALPTPINLPNGDVDIEFKVEEKHTAQISAGAGYNTQDKVVGNFGLGMPNFRGNGQSLSFNTDFGTRRNSFSISFTEPWLYGRPTLLGIDTYMLNRRWFNDYSEGRQGGSVRIGRRLRWPDNYFRIFTSYRLERDRYHDFDDSFIERNSLKTPFYLDRQDGDSQFDRFLGYKVNDPYPGSILEYKEDWLRASRISITITRDSRNLPEFATSGSKISYTFENTGGILGGFWNYRKHSFTASKFIPVFWKFALAVKLQYGVVTSPVADDSRILLSDRFLPGGINYDGIVRGYVDGVLTPDSLVAVTSDTTYFFYDSTAVIGVDIPDDTVITSSGSSGFTRIRGNLMLVTNIELQFPISEQLIYGLFFFDAGNSWLRRKDIKPIKGLYKSAGVGFRLLVPGIGTIGYDFGYAFDSIRGSDRGWRGHFQIGTVFR